MDRRVAAVFENRGCKTSVLVHCNCDMFSVNQRAFSIAPRVFYYFSSHCTVLFTDCKGASNNYVLKQSRNKISEGFLTTLEFHYF